MSKLIATQILFYSDWTNTAIDVVNWKSIDIIQSFGKNKMSFCVIKFNEGTIGDVPSWSVKANRLPYLSSSLYFKTDSLVYAVWHVTTEPKSEFNFTEITSIEGHLVETEYIQQLIHMQIMCKMQSILINTNGANDNSMQLQRVNNALTCANSITLMLKHKINYISHKRTRKRPIFSHTQPCTTSAMAALSLVCTASCYCHLPVRRLSRF